MEKSFLVGVHLKATPITPQNILIDGGTEIVAERYGESPVGAYHIVSIAAKHNVVADLAGEIAKHAVVIRATVHKIMAVSAIHQIITTAAEQIIVATGTGGRTGRS